MSNWYICGTMSSIFSPLIYILAILQNHIRNDNILTISSHATMAIMAIFQIFAIMAGPIIAINSNILWPFLELFQRMAEMQISSENRICIYIKLYSIHVWVCMSVCVSQKICRALGGPSLGPKETPLKGQLERSLEVLSWVCENKDSTKKRPLQRWGWPQKERWYQK